MKLHPFPHRPHRPYTTAYRENGVVISAPALSVVVFLTLPMVRVNGQEDRLSLDNALYVQRRPSYMDGDLASRVANALQPPRWSCVTGRIDSIDA